ncbi:esterase/lipase family protein [Rubritalea marina]|uniref:esterase/lipase family protein n=1 Tax=Rubritalea marina TaxID=361055 RepID=UPI0003618DF6|nr:alpha/beta fold hydrolase [Rubritalea marina]
MMCSAQHFWSRASTIIPPIPGLSYSHDFHGDGEELVIAMHGLWRSKFAMGQVVRALQADGYATLNVSYSSYAMHLEEMVELLRSLIEQYAGSYRRVHFVTHSLGCVVFRRYWNQFGIQNLGRVVMLAPPLQGSWIMDWLGESPFVHCFGPAGKFLSTESMANEVAKLPDEVMVIMGKVPKITIFQFVFDGVANDGIVRVDSGKVQGLQDFHVLSIDHTLITSDPTVLKLSRKFLKKGEVV